MCLLIHPGTAALSAGCETGLCKCKLKTDLSLFLPHVKKSTFIVCSPSQGWRCPSQPFCSGAPGWLLRVTASERGHDVWGSYCSYLCSRRQLQRAYLTTGGSTSEPHMLRMSPCSHLSRTSPGCLQLSRIVSGTGEPQLFCSDSSGDPFKCFTEIRLSHLVRWSMLSELYPFKRFKVFSLLQDFFTLIFQL